MIFGFNTDVKVGTVVYHVQSEARQKDLLLQTQVFVRGQCVGKCTSPFPEEEVLLDFAEDALQQSLKAQHRRIVAAVREERLEQELNGGVAPASNQMAGTAAQGGENASGFGVPAPPLEPPVLPLEQLLQVELEEAAAVAENFVAPGSGRVPVDTPAVPQQAESLAASPEGLATGSLKIECTNAQWVQNEQSLLLVLRVHREETPVDYAALTLRLAIGQSRPLYAYSSTDGNGVAALAITVEDTSGREGKVLVQAESEGESATRRFHLHPLS